MFVAASYSVLWPAESDRGGARLAPVQYGCIPVGGRDGLFHQGWRRLIFAGPKRRFTREPVGPLPVAPPGVAVGFLQKPTDPPDGIGEQLGRLPKNFFLRRRALALFNFVFHIRAPLGGPPRPSRPDSRGLFHIDSSDQPSGLGRRDQIAAALLE